MNFGEALQALKEGKKVKREIWGGYWYLSSNVSLSHDTVCNIIGGKMSQLILASLKDTQEIAPAQPYQQDLLAEDWQIIY